MKIVVKSFPLYFPKSNIILLLVLLTDLVISFSSSVGAVINIKFLPCCLIGYHLLSASYKYLPIPKPLEATLLNEFEIPPFTDSNSVELAPSSLLTHSLLIFIAN